MTTRTLEDAELTAELVRRRATLPDRRMVQMVDGTVLESLQHGDGRYGAWQTRGRVWPGPRTMSNLRHAASPVVVPEVEPVPMTAASVQQRKQRKTGSSALAPGLKRYLALPTVGCGLCGAEFSEPVGRLHAQRTGHAVGRSWVQAA